MGNIEMWYFSIEIAEILIVTSCSLNKILKTFFLLFAVKQNISEKNILP